MSSLNNRDLAVPFHIPSIAYGNHKPSNIFVSKNVTSKFIALNRPEVPPPPRSTSSHCATYTGAGTIPAQTRIRTPTYSSCTFQTNF